MLRQKFDREDEDREVCREAAVKGDTVALESQTQIEHANRERERIREDTLHVRELFERADASARVLQ